MYKGHWRLYHLYCIRSSMHPAKTSPFAHLYSPKEGTSPLFRVIKKLTVFWRSTTHTHGLHSKLHSDEYCTEINVQLPYTSNAPWWRWGHLQEYSQQSLLQRVASGLCVLFSTPSPYAVVISITISLAPHKFSQCDTNYRVSDLKDVGGEFDPISKREWELKLLSVHSNALKKIGCMCNYWRKTIKRHTF